MPTLVPPSDVESPFLCTLTREDAGKVFFFFNDPAPPEISPLPLPAALPTSPTGVAPRARRAPGLNPPLNFLGEIVNKKTHTQGDVLTGWYGGGGVDFALTKIVTVGLEYKHVDWGNVTDHLMTGVNGGPVFPGNSHLDLDADQVSFKVNILIGPLGH